MKQELKIEITEKDFQTFLDISVHLTGFGKNELLATGMHEVYYYTMMKEPDQDNVRAFFKEAQAILDETGNDEEKMNAEIAARLIPTDRYLGFARRIILMWYTGIWTTDILKNGKMDPTPVMISSQAYTEGLIWTAAETHPAGTKHAGFGSWAFPPLHPDQPTIKK